MLNIFPDCDFDFFLRFMKVSSFLLDFYGRPGPVSPGVAVGSGSGGGLVAVAVGGWPVGVGVAGSVVGVAVAGSVVGVTVGRYHEILLA